MQTSILSPTEKYAAAALFSLALHHSQILQTRLWNPLLAVEEEPLAEAVTIGKDVSVSDQPQLWIHENSGLLLPVFRSMGLDDKAWQGLKETAGVSTQARHHAASFLKLLSEESDDASSDRKDKENALAKSVNTTVLNIDCVSSEDTNKKSLDYGIQCRENHPSFATKGTAANPDEALPKASPKMHIKGNKNPETLMQEGAMLSEQRKLTVLYELLSACLVDTTDEGSKSYQLKMAYDARHRVALRLLATWLSVKWINVEAMEIMLAQSLVNSMKAKGEEEYGNKTSDQMENWKRGGVIGAAALTGGAVMAITGGLAAPAIAHGLGALSSAGGAGGFAAAASATGSAAGSAVITASFGAAGAGLAGTKMARRIGNLEEFEFKETGKNHNQGRLAVGILISGVAFKDEDFVGPWEGYDDNLERYLLKWESEVLIGLSSAIEDYLTSIISTQLVQDGAMLTVLSTLASALTLPTTLITAADIIDSKWAVAIDRSDKAGKLLAEVLSKGLQGNRPVMLVGFSLGARVIIKCLQYLAEMKGDNNAGIVERVVLLGAPVSINDENWEEARKVVAGRFVNVYSTNDWTLGVIFRASLLSQGLAGIQPVDIHGIENVDVTEYMEGHASYLWKTKEILEQLDLDNYHPVSKNSIAETQKEKSTTSSDP